MFFVKSRQLFPQIIKYTAAIIAGGLNAYVHTCFMGNYMAQSYNRYLQIDTLTNIQYIYLYFL